jgi:hypothetical protein
VVPADATPAVELPFVPPAGADVEVGGGALLLLERLVGGSRRRVHHPVLQRGIAR